MLCKLIEKSTARNIDLKRVVVQRIPFIGLGGTLSSPLSNLKIQSNHVKKSLHSLLDPTTVLVTHVPPYKLQDRVFIGSHGGSKELRHLIDTYRPQLVLCGHIHEDPGVTVSGTTTVVNCSLGKRTEGAFIEIKDHVAVTIIE